MSRIGKQPIQVPAEVTVNINGAKVVVNGPKGSLEILVPMGINVKNEEGKIVCQKEESNNKQFLNNWGLARTLVNNAVLGVTTGWTKTLELQGVGYRAAVEGDILVLNVGFSHQVKIKAPVGLVFSVAENKIKVSGFDKQAVGEMAAKIHRIRPPEPYKGKGIRFEGEKIRRKIGKAAKTIGGAGGGK